ncbi:MAG: hypothetical protein ACJAYS_000175 [Lentimonas sp.]|jgi:hypothetical protein
MNTHSINYIVFVVNFQHLGFRLLLFTLFLIAGSSPLKSNESENTSVFNKLQFVEQVNASIYSGWNSHYFTEGRDLLDGDSLIINHVQASWEFLRNEIWYAASPDQSYDELQLMTTATQTFKNYTLYAGYRHLQFPSDNLNDDEIYVGLTIADLPAEFQITVDAYHSFEANGFFVEISAFRNFNITGAWSVSGTGIFSINQGYVADGHDGANHFALSLQSTYQFSDSISIIAQLTQSWAINRDSSLPGDEQLVDFLNGGIGAQWFF